MRVKCDSLGLMAEDYYKDHLDNSSVVFTEGSQTIYATEAEIDELYETGSVELKENDDVIDENSYYVVKTKNSSKSALSYFRKEKLYS